MSGSLFINTEKISASIAPIIQLRIIHEIHSCFPDIEVLPIGSVGHKHDNDFHGDIDIAIKVKDIETLEKLINCVFHYVPKITVESIYIVSIAYPYKYNGELKHVQCDFMLMWDNEYTAFRYKCPNYSKNESNYKVGAKIMFSNMILNHCLDELNKNLPDDCFAKFDFRPMALYRYIINYKAEKWKEEFISINPVEIAGYVFKDSNPNNFDTVESLWNAIHSDNFKYPEEVKIIEKNWFVNCWRKGWTSIKPEDFKLQHWTNEEIWNHIEQQKLINDINRAFAKGREI